MKKKRVETAAAQIVVNITPQPLPDAPAYLIARKLTYEELSAFTQAWYRMSAEMNVKRPVMYLPEGTELKELHTEHLKQLRKRIDEALKEREVQ